MRRTTKNLLVAIFLFLLSSPLAADVVKIVVDDMIHPITDEYIGRALEFAKQRKAEAVLIQLRTPGGLVDSTRSIIEKIEASPVPVIVYVAPSGSRAASAGFFILESADVAAMAPGTNTGAAHPVAFSPFMTEAKQDDVMKTKVENDTAAWMRSFVSKRGRNVEAAESAVRQSKSWTEQEALKEHLIDYVAPNEAELLKLLDGKTVTRFNGTTAVLHTAGQAVVEYDMSLKQRILAWMMDPNVAFIIFAIGMLALYVEFNHPGAVAPGVVGFICILLALFALNILPTRFAALALIVGAFVLFALEAKFQSHGVLAVGGIALMVLGAMLLVDGPIPEMRVKLVTALAVSIPLAGITVFLMTLVLRARRNKVVTGEQGLVGTVGVVRSPLTPQGKVFVNGELWDAYSTAPVQLGEQVRVVRVDGLALEVEPVRHEAAQPARA
ncbi:MAG TPA: nodulation protein NfeD [Terriglobales bacterium]|nr:nodulation protein NfeD [Terriglobales bacterium]